MVVALLYEMQTPCNCFTLSLSGSDSRRSNSWRDDNHATMEIKVSSRDHHRHRRDTLISIVASLSSRQILLLRLSLPLSDKVK